MVVHGPYPLDPRVVREARVALAKATKSTSLRPASPASQPRSTSRAFGSFVSRWSTRWEGASAALSRSTPAFHYLPLLVWPDLALQAPLRDRARPQSAGLPDRGSTDSPATRMPRHLRYPRPLPGHVQHALRWPPGRARGRSALESTRTVGHEDRRRRDYGSRRIRPRARDARRASRQADRRHEQRRRAIPPGAPACKRSKGSASSTTGR